MKRISHLNDIDALSQYLSRINAEPRSLRTAVVKEQIGRYWRDIAVIRIDQDGTVVTDKVDLQPTAEEQLRIKDECSRVKFPELLTLARLVDLPDKLKNADRRDIYEFRDEHGNIVMLQQRLDQGPGEKRYVPWTFWDDQMWRATEPDGKLPIYGIEQLKNFSTVMIHEGAKAARFVREMCEAQTPEMKRLLEAHPWGNELQHMAHLGWIGGALSPSRTDWAVLRRLGVKQAYIVSDNDAPGLAAVPPIAYQLRCPTFHIQFTNEWPPSFDLADEFPATMFREIEGTRHYVGPPMRSCQHPATWATDQIKNPKGKPTTVLREDFKDQWAYIEEIDMFVCIPMPEILRTSQIMNNILAPFSHVNNTSTLMVRAYRGRKTKLCYRPDIKGRIVTDNETSAINLHTPSPIRPVKGNPAPFLEFMQYLVPEERERTEVMRWIATLIAKPGVRMEYGLLLVSETQGVGKTTLGSKILAPLVGGQNTGFPSEREIVESSFNSWVAHKRLVVVNEIYSGHSWKAYNTLKGFITDKEIDINQKYMRPYRIECWAHVIANSNSRRALRMEQDDRRWFYPTVTEVPWPRQKFQKLIDWLQSGGLSIIMDWAIEYGDYVSPGERAPMTNLKMEMIEQSRSEAAREFADLCAAVEQDKQHVVFAMKDIVAWLRTAVDGKVYDSDYELRKVASNYGFQTYPKRIKVGGRLQYVLLSKALVQDANGFDLENLDDVKKYVKNPRELMDSTM